VIVPWPLWAEAATLSDDASCLTIRDLLLGGVT
jgi:hypothetical protein